jgi:predicted ATP-binding protein involved in virulence
MSIIAAYSPSKALRYLANPDLTKRLSYHDASCLAFDTTVHNEAIQAWLLSLYSKRAIARDRSQSGDEYSKPLERLESALRSLYDQDVSFEVEIERAFQLRLKFRGHSLDFSQLPDGVRSTLAWIADFMMRQDLIPWANFGLLNKRPGILLLDEADAHLHPHWQRRLLPAVRAALPDVQIIVTSHSPFVISSCPGSRVHVLEVDGEGRACAKAPVDSPIGESVTTTLKEIFGVDSRFDVLTERELNRWNDLKKAEAMDSLSPPEKAELDQLTITLGERSEELRSIVSAQSNASKLVLESLTTKRKRRVS